MKPFLALVSIVLFGVFSVGSGHELNVTVYDDRVSLPQTVGSGYVTFGLENRSQGTYAHDILRLKPGGDAEVVRRALSRFFSGQGSEDDFAKLMRHADELGGGAVGTPPGRTREVGVNLTPGTYVVYADRITGEGTQLEVSHTAVVTVTKAADPDPAPEPDLTVPMADYAFALPASVPAGTHLVRFTNVGQETHLGFVFELPAGMTREEAMAHDGPVDWATAQGVHALDAGEFTDVEMTFKPGRTYLFDCPIPNDEGTPHDAMGMMQFVTISD